MARNLENDKAFMIKCVERANCSQENPTSEFVIEFYHRFQETMKNILSRMVNNEADAAPKANGESIYSVLRFVNKYLRDVFKNRPHQVSIYLTLTDMYEPTAKRTRKIFETLLDLLLFYDAKMPLVRDMVTKRLEKAQAYKNKMEQEEALIEKLAGEAESLASLDDEINKLQEEEKKAMLRYENLQEQKSENDTQLLNLRRELRVMVSSCENKHALLTNVQAGVQKLKEQVVPEEDVKTLVDRKENLVKRSLELDNETESLQENLLKRRPGLERFDNINKQLITLKNASEKLRPTQNSVLCASEQLQLRVEHYEKSSKELKARTENILKYEEGIKAVQEATAKNNTSKEQMQQELKQVKSEIIKEQEDQIDVLRQKDTLQGQIEATKKEIEKIKSEIEQLKLSYEDKYKNMLSMENASTSECSAILEHIRNELERIRDHENSEAGTD